MDKSTFIIATYDDNGKLKGELVYKSSRATADRNKQVLSAKIPKNNSVIGYYSTHGFTEEDVLQNISSLYIGRNGLASKCKKCGGFFVSNNQHRYWCNECYNDTHKNVVCPICGKVFTQKYQHETYCSKTCKGKGVGNFSNPIILKKIAETNKLKYGCENPFNNSDVQKKCRDNNNREQQKEKLKRINNEKYKESRRLKQLKSKSKQISHKEMVLIDTLQKIYTIQPQYTFDDCVFRKKMRFDIFRPRQDVVINEELIHVDNLIIEYDGEQHRKPTRFNNISDSQMYTNFISTQVKDWFKDKYCIDKNIPLIRIDPTAMSNPTFNDIYKNASIIGENQASNKQFKCFDVIAQDFVNNAICTFTIESGISCTFKCDKENNCQMCHNFALTKQQPIETSINRLIELYDSQELSHSVTFQGLEPLDNLKQLLWFIYYFRQTHDDFIYIWTGYDKNECKDLIYLIKEKMQWKNIVIKFGRYRPNDTPHLDPILGINLSSSNQYAEVIS